MPVCKDFVRCNVGRLSLQRFHLYDGIFLGRWYPKGLQALSPQHRAVLGGRDEYQGKGSYSRT